MVLRLPLHGVRVLDLTEGAGQSCGRYLADLGADVTLVEPPGGCAGRKDDPVRFALWNANKRGVVIDLATSEGASRLRQLVAATDILLAAGDLRACEHTRPDLVAVSITDFGRTGPYREFVATEAVLAALGALLSRSGRPGARPVLPPRGLVEHTVGVHAAWAALVAYARRLRTGRGEWVDVSALEAVVHGFDPGFGTQGSAAAGRPESFPRDRPDAANFYPVFPCADGHVRLCLLAKRQWRAMFRWLGEPEEFADPRYDTIAARFEAADRLNPLITELFAGASRQQLVEKGTQLGVPIAGVLTPEEVLDAEHFARTGTLVDTEIAPGRRARVPSGYVRIDGRRAGIRRRAPEVGEHDDADTLAPEAAPRELGLGGDPAQGPLAGLRVLDLGVIVFGAELGRLFADQGADVIKVENAEFPDGLRQTRGGASMNASCAWGLRNKRGLGLNLRDPSGLALFRELVRDADIVAANFKPGTLQALGLSYAELSRINPRVILCDSSAFGGGGPWSPRLGYGPLVRASCGISALWRDPELGTQTEDTGGFCDGSTVYPDHIAAHVASVALLALVIGRGTAGRGAHLELAQADVATFHLGATLVEHSASITRARVYRCLGDDEWCVIEPRDTSEQASLAKLVGVCEPADEASVAAWASQRTPTEVMVETQRAGVPAGAMMRLPDELTDAHLSARESFRTLHHPLLRGPLPTNARIAVFSSMADPPLRPAPLPGEHTREICAQVLGMSEQDIDRLVRAGVLQPPPAQRGHHRDVNREATA